MAETLRDFLKRVETLPPDTLLCVAELDEAFAANVAEVEVIENAKAQSTGTDGTEAIELENGNQTVIVIRW
ncbi:sugar phosphorylase [Microvirga brassicacearum]|uniref:Sugar phosphorylase n=1 Tax=Microvirga brassicacearum TaxID=2580413 RepID=A0A5N3P5Z4_9HYPH|nr:sugar phosphorylase [Microvirga brassicacearum]KAB0265139.1 sugar phosphorylase [Microvirga brassicacearum]